MERNIALHTFKLISESKSNFNLMTRHQTKFSLMLNQLAKMLLQAKFGTIETFYLYFDLHFFLQAATVIG